ncbi:MAG: hypothetical protein Kow00129_13120 [Thermoleophilia bacterium]
MATSTVAATILVARAKRARVKTGPPRRRAPSLPPAGLGVRFGVLMVPGVCGPEGPVFPGPEAPVSSERAVPATSVSAKEGGKLLRKVLILLTKR